VIVGAFVRPAPLGDSDISLVVGELVATVEVDGDPEGDSVATDTTDVGDSVSTEEVDGDPVGDSVAFTRDGELVGEVVTTEVTGASVMIVGAEGELVGDPVLSAVEVEEG